jgi:hypothetical protein
MDFRYSLFLMVYTWNGVVLCQYTGVCCQAGSVLEFGGKAASTCLGAVWAMIWSILIVPMYTSEVVLGLESSFLLRAFAQLDDSWHRVDALLDDQDAEVSDPKVSFSIESIESGEAQGFRTSALRAQLLGDVDAITRLRIGSFKAFAKEIEFNSLDKRELHFVKLNLIPLPRSVHLVVKDMSVLGSMISASFKSLHLALGDDMTRAALKDVLNAVRRPTNDLLATSGVLVAALAEFLADQRGDCLAIHRDVVERAVADVGAARGALAKAWRDAVQPEIIAQNPSPTKLKLLAYYAFMLRALYRLETLGSAVMKEHGYSERDSWSTFWTSWCTGPPQQVMVVG